MVALTAMFYVAAALTLAAAAGAATAEAPKFVELPTFNVSNNNNNVDRTNNNNNNGSESSHDDRRPTTGPPSLVGQKPPQQQQRQRPQPIRFRPEASAIRVIYQTGSSEEELPVCEKWAVCSKVDMYQWPWVERRCRCPPGIPPCSQMLSQADGRTIADKTRQFKLCEPVKTLPRCRYFRDMTWTLRSEGNGTLQTVHCRCPKGSVAYLLKRQAYAYQTESKQIGYQYSFACSPQSRLRCQGEEPCRLFTVLKRKEMVDEVNTNALCQCPPEHACPSHHKDVGVIQSNNYSEQNIWTYSGYCTQPSTIDQLNQHLQRISSPPAFKWPGHVDSNRPRSFCHNDDIIIIK